ncbi:hypothetical protein [Rubritalea marina]|uniref:hypothetical protein n=1 Tax=Rubritalea marina TaxID=361055 RepID=UPI00037F3D44|nr:hypothetical protein [Rubritalea marina]
MKKSRTDSINLNPKSNNLLAISNRRNLPSGHLHCYLPVTWVFNSFQPLNERSNKEIKTTAQAQRSFYNDRLS